MILNWHTYYSKMFERVMKETRGEIQEGPF